MKSYFFFFSLLAILMGSLWGTRKYLNRLLLAWSMPTVVFLAYFVAMKNFQYMLPAVIPLVCGAFLFPSVAEINSQTPGLTFLKKPATRKILWGVTIGMFTSQFAVNLVILYLYLVVGR
jgi:uncharacterized membrane protein